MLSTIRFPHTSALHMPTDYNVMAVALSQEHTGLHKDPQPSIELIKDQGVKHDIHAGKPGRQVSLLQSESLKVLNDMNKGNDPIRSSELGENITTMGLNFDNFKQGTKLRFISDKESEDVAVISITGMRRPGEKLEKRREGLKEQCIVRDANGKEVGSRVGVMGVVLASGTVTPGMTVGVIEPPGMPRPLEFL